MTLHEDLMKLFAGAAEDSAGPLTWQRQMKEKRIERINLAIVLDEKMGDKCSYTPTLIGGIEENILGPQPVLF